MFNHGTGNDTSHDHQRDEVLDFTPGIDRIDLSNTRVQDFGDLFTDGDRYMEDTGIGVLIHTSEDHDTSILLINVRMSDLTENDFIF